MYFKNVFISFASKACIDTVLFGQVCDDCKGGAIAHVLAMVLRIMTAGIFVLATAGIIWGGFLIMTSRDNPAVKAKGVKRIIEVVVGVFLYALMAGIASLISPGGDLNAAMNPDAVVACEIPDPPAVNPYVRDHRYHGTGGSSSGSGGSSGGSSTGGGAASASDLPVSPLGGNSDSVPCDPRTTFVKTYTKAHISGNQVTINLCKVPNIVSTGGGDVLVNSRVSGAYYAMADAYYKQHGTYLSASSSFRSYEDQQYFWRCYVNKNCNGGNTAARPGTSRHEGGLAIDFNVPNGSTANGAITSCASTDNFGSVTDKRYPSRWKYSALSKWFCANLGTYGFRRPVKNEVWHVEPTLNYY